MNNEQILENAPKGATHVSIKAIITYLKIDGKGTFWFDDGYWRLLTYACTNNIHSLSDLRRIVELEKELKNQKIINSIFSELGMSPTKKQMLNTIKQLKQNNREYQLLIERAVELEKKRDQLEVSQKASLDVLCNFKRNPEAFLNTIRAAAVIQAANATNEVYAEGRSCPYESLVDYANRIHRGEL